MEKFRLFAVKIASHLKNEKMLIEDPSSLWFLRLLYKRSQATHSSSKQNWEALAQIMHSF